MARKIVNTIEIGDIINNRVQPIKENVFDAELYTNIAIPSSVHAYSLGIEFIKQWFYKDIPEKFFKFTWVNSSHMMADFRLFNKQHIKRERPYLAIIPKPDMEWDRENIDFYNAGNKVFLKRSNLQGSFFRDYVNRLFMNVQLREMKIEFEFRIRVDTRAQQLDLYRRMEMIYGKRTRTFWISCDFVIPYELCTNIAAFAGFKINKIGEIEDPLAFLAYMNSHSEIPVTYKFRAVNGHNEFFIRMSDIYAHTSTLANIDIDEGERDGMLENNFGITLPVELKMAVPQFFVLYDEKELIYKLETVDSPFNAALYTMAQFTVPDVNEKGWTQIINTAYMLDEGEKEIDISPMFESNQTMNIKRVIQFCKDNYLSPSCFIDVKMYQENGGQYRAVPFYMHYESMTMELTTGGYTEDSYLYIAVYVDMEYVNTTMVSINELYKKRMTGVDDPSRP